MHTLQLEPEGIPVVTASAGSYDTASSSCKQVLVVLLQEDAVKANGSTSELNSDSLAGAPAEVQSAARYAVSAAAFKGKKGEVGHLTQLMLPGNAQAQSLLLLGLGPTPKEGAAAAQPAPAWGCSGHQEAGTALAAAAKRHHLKHLTIVVDSSSSRSSAGGGGGSAQGAPAAAAVTSAASGLLTSFLSHLLYERTSLKSDNSAVHHVELVELVGVGADAAAALQAEGTAVAAAAVAYAKGVYLTRYLIDLPANICTPSCLAEAAAFIAGRAPGALKLQVLERDDCLSLGMGLYLGVAQGSEEPPKFIHLTYKSPASGSSSSKPVALVGKGLTFDTGGINLKVHGGVETMKCDMGGAAAVLGAARIIAELQPPGLEAHFITAACENMISGTATRPSDIHTSASGKTVEVNDTDAEGRLTLADALWFAQEKAGAQVVIDIATLTGACGIALGQETAGLFSNIDGLAEAVTAASSQAGEKFWRLPLDPALKKLLDSHVADLKNYAGRWGGAITAALFLNEFIKPGVEWAHCDIAGPAWSDKEGGATGFGAATLANWLRQRSSSACV